VVSLIVSASLASAQTQPASGPDSTIGSQYVERFTNYGIGNNNYWDWQIGISASVYGFDLSFAYVDTNLGVAGCGNTMNCDARALFTVSKTF